MRQITFYVQVLSIFTTGKLGTFNDYSKGEMHSGAVFFINNIHFVKTLYWTT
jgi:hypothetical protein